MATLTTASFSYSFAVEEEEIIEHDAARAAEMMPRINAPLRKAAYPPPRAGSPLQGDSIERARLALQSKAPAIAGVDASGRRVSRPLSATTVKTSQPVTPNTGPATGTR